MRNPSQVHRHAEEPLDSAPTWSAAVSARRGAASHKTHLLHRKVGVFKGRHQGCVWISPNLVEPCTQLSLQGALGDVGSEGAQIPAMPVQNAQDEVLPVPRVPDEEVILVVLAWHAWVCQPAQAHFERAGAGPHRRPRPACSAQHRANTSRGVAASTRCSEAQRTCVLRGTGSPATGLACTHLYCLSGHPLSSSAACRAKVVGFALPWRCCGNRAGLCPDGVVGSPEVTAAWSRVCQRCVQDFDGRSQTRQMYYTQCFPEGRSSGLVRAAPARARSLSQHHLERPPHIKATLTEGQHEVLQHCPTIQVHNPERGLRSCSGVAEAPCTALPQHGHHCADGQVTWQA